MNRCGITAERSWARCRQDGRSAGDSRHFVMHCCSLGCRRQSPGERSSGSEFCPRCSFTIIAERFESRKCIPKLAKPLSRLYRQFSREFPSESSSHHGIDALTSLIAIGAEGVTMPSPPSCQSCSSHARPGHSSHAQGHVHEAGPRSGGLSAECPMQPPALRLAQHKAGVHGAEAPKIPFIARIARVRISAKAVC